MIGVDTAVAERLPGDFARRLAVSSSSSLLVCPLAVPPLSCLACSCS